MTAFNYILPAYSHHQQTRNQQTRYNKVCVTTLSTSSPSTTEPHVVDRFSEAASFEDRLRQSAVATVLFSFFFLSAEKINLNLNLNLNYTRYSIA